MAAMGLQECVDLWHNFFIYRFWHISAWSYSSMMSHFNRLIRNMNRNKERKCEITLIYKVNHTSRLSIKLRISILKNNAPQRWKTSLRAMVWLDSRYSGNNLVITLLCQEQTKLLLNNLIFINCPCSNCTYFSKNFLK